MNVVSIDIAERIRTYDFIFMSLGYSVERKAIVGDYAYGDLIGFERKSAGDFVSSLHSKKLFAQCDELADAYKIPILAIDCIPDELLPRFQPTSRFTGIFASIKEHHGCFPIWTFGQLPFYLDAFVRKATDGGSEIKASPVRQQTISTATQKDITASILRQIPGIGPHRAELYSHLPLIEAIRKSRTNVRKEYREHIGE